MAVELGKELLDLNGGVGLTSAQLGGAMGIYIVDPANGSRFVTLAELKTFINTDPTVVPSSVPWRGARVKRTTNLSVSSGVTTPATWEAADVDTHSFWSAGNPTRLTVPTGVTKVRLTANAQWVAGATGVRLGLFQKNGADFAGMAYQMMSAHATEKVRNNVVSSVVAVAAGDYFTFSLFHSQGSALNLEAADRTWFQIEVIEASA